MSEKLSSYEVVVHLQQIAGVTVQAESQANAEEKIQRFCDAYLKLNDDQKKVVPSFPFEVNSTHFDLLEVLHAGDLPPSMELSNRKKILNSSKDELKKLMESHNYSENYLKDIQEESQKEIDVSKPEEFVNLKKTQKVKFKE